MYLRILGLSALFLGTCLVSAFAQSEAEIYQMMEQRRQGGNGGYQQSAPNHIPGDLPGGSYGQQQQQYGNERQNQYRQQQNQYQRDNRQQYSNGQTPEWQNASSVSNMSGWTAVGVPGVFSASMPGTPNQRESVMQGVSSTTWESDSSEPMHMFSIEMIPFNQGSIGSGNVDNLLFSLMNSRAKAMGVPPTNKRRIDNSASPGCMFKLKSEDSEWSFMIRILGDTVLTFSVCSMPGDGDDQYVQQFFRSFSLH